MIHSYEEYNNHNDDSVSYDVSHFSIPLLLISLNSLTLAKDDLIKKESPLNMCLPNISMANPRPEITIEIPIPKIPSDIGEEK